MEKRFLATEVRAKKNGDKRTITGYAARYNVLSSDLGGFRERISSGAFKRILTTNPDVVCLFNHDVNKVLGRTTAGTLRLKEDSRGLAFECDVPDTQAGNDTYESVQRGDINGCSFAFQVDDARMCDYREEEIDPEFDEDNEGIRGKVKRAVSAIVRTIKDFAALIDVSAVTHPAYPNTSVDARNLLVGAEVRSRVQTVKAIGDQIRQRLTERSFEDIIAVQRLRNSRLRILDL